MPVDGFFDGKYLYIDIHKYPKIQLKGEGVVEIESENSNLRLYFDGADIMWIEHKLRDIKISSIDTINSFIKEMDAKITIYLNEVYAEE